jgi:hypothetical protein
MIFANKGRGKNHSIHCYLGIKRILKLVFMKTRFFSPNIGPKSPKITIIIYVINKNGNFSPKKCPKSPKITIITDVFNKNGNLSPKMRPKSPKILILTLSPGHPSLESRLLLIVTSPRSSPSKALHPIGPRRSWMTRCRACYFRIYNNDGSVERLFKVAENSLVFKTH